MNGGHSVRRFPIFQIQIPEIVDTLPLSIDLLIAGAVTAEQPNDVIDIDPDL